MKAPEAGASPKLPFALRAAALGGLIGPACFIAAWLAAGAVTDLPYSPIEDTISRLAAVGADTRVLMSAGFVAFGIAVPAYAWALRATVGVRAAVAAAITGLATLGIAATPLDHSALVDGLHRLFAAIGYITLALVPLLAARPLRAQGHGRVAAFGVICGSISAACLIASVAPLPSGLFQRAGLTATDLWLAGSALMIAAGHLGQCPTAEDGRAGLR